MLNSGLPCSHIVNRQSIRCALNSNTLSATLNFPFALSVEGSFEAWEQDLSDFRDGMRDPCLLSAGVRCLQGMLFVPLPIQATHNITKRINSTLAPKPNDY